MKVSKIACAIVIATSGISLPVFAQSVSFVESTPARFVPLEQATPLEMITDAAANTLGTNSTNSTNNTNSTNGTGGCTCSH